MLLATSRWSRPSYLSLQTIRRYQSTQKGKQFFNFVKTNKQQPLQKPTKIPTYDTESIFSPKLQLPNTDTQQPNVFNKKQPNSNPQPTEPQPKTIISKNIDGKTITNDYFNAVGSWPYREATEIPINTFSELGLHSDICKAIKAKNITQPTKVQSSIIYNMLLGEDMIIRSQTGTGKSFAIVTGILQQIRKYCTEEEIKGRQYYDKIKDYTKVRGPMKVLFLVPTRELGWQITKWIIEMENLGENYRHFVQLCAAGVEMPAQISNLKKYQPQIVVGTPKQLIKVLAEAPDALNFTQLRTIVVDEVDHIVQALSAYATQAEINNNFKHRPPGVVLVSEIKALVSTPAHQTIVASATVNAPTKREMRKMKWMNNPVLLNFGSFGLPDAISHHILFAEEHGDIEMQILSMVTEKIKTNPNFKAIIFTNPNQSVRETAKRCSLQGIETLDLSDALSFGNPATVRKALSDFQTGKVHLFLTSEFIARGIDLPDVDTVFIIDCFYDANSYVHMAGRTGRMGKGGEVYTVMVPENIFRIQKIFRYLSIPFPINLKEEQQKIEKEIEEEEPEAVSPSPEEFDGDEDVDETISKRETQQNNKKRHPKKKFSKYSK